MKIIDGLVFTWRQAGADQYVVRVQCCAEDGKQTGFAVTRKGKLTDEGIESGIRELTAWFNIHTRPDAKLVNAKNPFEKAKRPYKPAGYLRRLTLDESATVFTQWIGAPQLGEPVIPTDTGTAASVHAPVDEEPA